MSRRELQPLGAVARGDRAVAAREPLADESVHLRVVLDDEDGRQAVVLGGLRDADRGAERLERLAGGLVDAAVLLLRGPPHQDSGRGPRRNAEPGEGSALRGAGDPDRAAVHPGEVPGDREAEPRAPERLDGAAGVLAEALEDRLAHLRAHARAAVRDLDDEIASLDPEPAGDPPVGAGVPER